MTWLLSLPTWVYGYGWVALVVGWTLWNARRPNPPTRSPRGNAIWEPFTRRRR